MFSLSWQLTLFSFIIFALSFGIVRFLTVRSSHYFKVQQNKLGQINGYDEEMLNGLKVIKVFSHEPEAEEGFDKFNEELRGASGKANTYATILFPIMGNMGNLLYVLIAFIGGAAAINGWAPLTLGAIASFLQLSRQFSMPIAQISQQLNSIVLALAGAQRIFELEDEPSEVDNGDVIMSPNKEVKNSWYWDVPEKNGDIKKYQLRDILFLTTLTFHMFQNIKFCTILILMQNQE